MSLNIRKDDWTGILLYWLFSRIDEYILHDPTKYYDATLILNTKNQFCKYEYTKINGNGDFENTIKKIQDILKPCNTPTDIYKAVYSLFYVGTVEIIPNKGLLVNSRSTGEKYIIPQNYKKKKIYIVSYNNGEIDLRQKYICHLCELVHCKQWQFFNENLCRMTNENSQGKSAIFKYNDFEFDWGIFVWHKGKNLIDCPYNEDTLKFLFDGMKKLC